MAEIYDAEIDLPKATQAAFLQRLHGEDPPCRTFPLTKVQPTEYPRALPGHHIHRLRL